VIGEGPGADMADLLLPGLSSAAEQTPRGDRQIIVVRPGVAAAMVNSQVRRAQVGRSREGTTKSARRERTRRLGSHCPALHLPTASSTPVRLGRKTLWIKVDSMERFIDARRVGDWPVSGPTVVWVVVPRLVAGAPRTSTTELNHREPETGQERAKLAAPCSPNVPRFRSGFRKTPVTCGNVVGDTGFEPVTSSVSRKRATTAPIAHDLELC
jgi:hypothetical protein